MVFHTSTGHGHLDDERSFPAILGWKPLRSCCDNVPSPAPYLDARPSKAGIICSMGKGQNEVSPSGFSWHQPVVASSIRENPAAAPFGELLFGLFHANVSGD